MPLAFSALPVEALGLACVVGGMQRRGDIVAEARGDKGDERGERREERGERREQGPQAWAYGASRPSCRLSLCLPSPLSCLLSHVVSPHARLI
jgi:hypothetical protein